MLQAPGAAYALLYGAEFDPKLRRSNAGLNQAVGKLLDRQSLDGAFGRWRVGSRRPAPRPGRSRLAPRTEGPRMIFPPDGSTVQVQGFGPAARSLALAAGGQMLSCYVNGAPPTPDPVSGKVIWRPPSPGFYRVTVVDAAGRRAQALVRVTAG